MRVALDLEEVLADTIHEACQSTDKLSHDDFETWDLDDYTWQVYMGVSDALWRHDPLSIEPVEPALSQYVGDIRDSVDELDIVTARMHVDENVRRWLEEYNIPYDELHATSTAKHTLDYDVFIDDNPEMCGECRLLLRHHPHNSYLDTDEMESVNRIYSLAEVGEFL